MKKPGRPPWPCNLTDVELGEVIRQLHDYPYYAKVTDLKNILRLSHRDIIKRFLKQHRIRPVKGLVAWFADRGHFSVKTPHHYYDPHDLIYVLRRRLLNDLVLEERDPRTAPPVGAPAYQRPREFDRWDVHEIDARMRSGLDFEQWLYPQEVAIWLIVHEMTLYCWRRAGIGPPFVQGPNLVPSSRRNPDNTIKPLSRRTLQPSFNHRFDRVLYDRNRVVAWLKKIYLQRVRSGV
jgi:hypothetical protein